MKEKKCQVCSNMFIVKSSNHVNCSLRCQDRKKRIKKMYNIEPIAVNIMYEKQGGKCKICKIDIDVREMGFNNKKKGCIDHYEINGIKKVRGLLCFTCNKGIGLLYHDPKVIKEAIEYLKPFAESERLPSKSIITSDEEKTTTLMEDNMRMELENINFDELVFEKNGDVKFITNIVEQEYKELLIELYRDELVSLWQKEYTEKNRETGTIPISCKLSSGKNFVNYNFYITLTDVFLKNHI